MRNPRNPSRIQILMILVLNVSGVVNHSARSTLKYVRPKMFTVMSVVNMVTFRLFAKALGQFPKRAQRQQNSNSTDRKQTHYVSDAPVQSATGYYNEQGNWVGRTSQTSTNNSNSSFSFSQAKGSCHSRHSRHSSRD